MYALAGALLRIKGRQFVSPFLHLPNAYTRFLLLISPAAKRIDRIANGSTSPSATSACIALNCRCEDAALRLPKFPCARSSASLFRDTKSISTRE